MAFERDYSGWKAFRLWLAALVLACVIGWAGSFLPSVPARAQVAGAYPGSPNSSNVAVPITVNGTATTGAIGVSLPGAVGKTTYLCGYQIQATATTGISGSATITGLITAGWTILQAVGAAPAVATTQQTFTPCIPASGPNTSIGLNSIAAGTAGQSTLTAWGYQL